MVSHRDFGAAGDRGARRAKEGPVAVSARFDRRSGRVVIALNSGLELAFRPSDAQGLERAGARELSDIEVSPSGLGIHFPKLDADLYLPALLEGYFGSRRWMAARLGEAGGRSRSAAKSAASRANGKRGGRPRKIASA